MVSCLIWKLASINSINAYYFDSQVSVQVGSCAVGLKPQSLWMALRYFIFKSSLAEEWPRHLRYTRHIKLIFLAGCHIEKHSNQIILSVYETVNTTARCGGRGMWDESFGCELFTWVDVC